MCKGIDTNQMAEKPEMSFDGGWHAYMWWSMPKCSEKHLRGRKMSARDGQEQNLRHILTRRSKKKHHCNKCNVYFHTHNAQ